MTAPVILVYAHDRRVGKSDWRVTLDICDIPEFLQTDFIAFFEECKTTFGDKILCQYLQASKKLWNILKEKQVGSIAECVSDELYDVLIGYEVVDKRNFIVLVNAFREYLLKIHHKALEIHAYAVPSWNKQKTISTFYLTWLPKWIEREIIETINSKDSQNCYRQLNIFAWICKKAQEHNIDNKEVFFDSSFQEVIALEAKRYQRESYNVLRKSYLIENAPFVLRYSYVERKITYHTVETFEEVPDVFKEDYYRFCKTKFSKDIAGISLSNRKLISAAKRFWNHSSQNECRTYNDLLEVLVAFKKDNGYGVTFIYQFLGEQLNIDINREIIKVKKKEGNHFVIDYGENNIVYINLNNVDDAWKEHYVSHMKALSKVLSHSTLKGVNSSLNHWFCYLQTIGNLALNELNAEVMHGFIVYIKGKNFKTKTIRAQKEALQSYITALYHKKLIRDIQFLDALGKSKAQDPLIESLPESVMKQLGKALKKEQDPYTKAYLTIGYFLGLRHGEIVDLDVDCLKPMNEYEISGEAWELHYAIEKNDNPHRTRTLIPQPVVEAINQLKVHTQHIREISDTTKLFIHYRNNKVSVPYLAYFASKIASFVKIHQIIDSEGELIVLHSKILRTSFISRMVAAGVDPYTLSEMFHENIETTLKYYDKTNAEEYTIEMAEAVENIHIVKGFDELKTEFTIEVDDENYWRVGSGYCTSSKAVANKDHMCSHIRNWGNCFTCPSYVTTSDHIPALQRYVDEWEDEIELLLEQGRSEDSLKHLYARKDIVSLLVKRLQEFKSLYTEVNA